MLTVPRTTPSRCTMRLGGGSSTAGVGGVAGGALVTGDAGGAGGGSEGGAATGLVSATVAGGGGGSGGGVGAVPGASWRRYWAATKPHASAGASISVHAPLVPTSVTVSPRLITPSTLYSSPGPARRFNFLAVTVLLVASINELLTQTWTLAGRM